TAGRSRAGDLCLHVLALLLQRLQLELAHEQLEPLRLEQDLPRRGKGVVALVDLRAIDDDADALAFTQALDASPFAQRALDVVLAARVEQFLEIRIVQRPPELPVDEDLRL